MQYVEPDPVELDAPGLELVVLLDAAGLGLHRVDLATGRVCWASQAQLDLLGYDRDEYAGRPAADFHEDPAVGQDVLQRLRRGEPLRDREVDLRHKDGSVRHVLVSSAAHEGNRDNGDGRPCDTCLFRDVTRRKRAERRTRAEHAIARVLAEAATLGQATPGILEAVCRTTGWSWGALWCVERDGADGREPVLRCAEFWRRPDAPVVRFEAATRRVRFRRGDGLPGRVWAAGAPAWVDDVAGAAERDELPRRGAAVGDGVHGALAFPVTGHAGGVLGVMEFFSRHPRAPDPDLLGMMRAIGAQVGQYIERRRGEEELANTQARHAAIVRAAMDGIVSVDHRGRVLEWNPAAERTFGYARDEAVGREIAELIVPPRLRNQHRLGLARHLLSGAGPVVGRRVETRAVRKDGGEFPIEVAISRIPSGGPPTFTAHVRDLSEREQAEGTSASLRAALRELLVAREIQEGVLPKRVPRLPGIEVAGMVRAAAQCSGDFYDFLMTPEGHALVVLGDVSGHGVGPALVAAQTATCLRTLARTYAGVDRLLTEANAIIAEATPPTMFVTMLLVGIDPLTRSLTYANAGHPSGVIVGPDRRVRSELTSLDLPLAVSPDGEFGSGGPVPLGAGDLVVLVSDGLLEAWSPEGDAFGPDRLRELACALQPESAATVVDRLYDAVRAFTRWTTQHDDMSAVAVKVKSE